MKQSPKGQMNASDWKSMGKQAIKYFAPLIVMFLLAIQQGVPFKNAIVLVEGGLLQMAINFFSKLNDGPKV